MNLKHRECVEWIQLAQDCVHGKALVNMVIDFVFSRSRKIHKLCDCQILKNDGVSQLAKTSQQRRHWK